MSVSPAPTISSAQSTPVTHFRGNANLDASPIRIPMSKRKLLFDEEDRDEVSAFSPYLPVLDEIDILGREFHAIMSNDPAPGFSSRLSEVMIEIEHCLVCEFVQRREVFCAQVNSVIEKDIHQLQTLSSLTLFGLPPPGAMMNTVEESHLARMGLLVEADGLASAVLALRHTMSQIDPLNLSTYAEMWKRYMTTWLKWLHTLHRFIAWQ